MTDFLSLLLPIANKVQECLDLASIALDEKDSLEAGKLMADAKKWNAAKQDVLKAMKEKFGERFLSPQTKELLKSLLPEKPKVNMEKEMALMGLPNKPIIKEERDMNFAERLAKIANQLDEKGLYEEADLIDKMIDELDADDQPKRREPTPQPATIPPITTGPAPQVQYPAKIEQKI
jgi:hypothetical protein